MKKMSDTMYDLAYYIGEQCAVNEPIRETIGLLRSEMKSFDITPNTRCEDGKTLLFYLAAHATPVILEAAKYLKFDFLARDKCDNTALFEVMSAFAIMRSYDHDTVGSIELCVEYGLTFSDTNISNQTPLFGWQLHPKSFGKYQDASDVENQVQDYQAIVDCAQSHGAILHHQDNTNRTFLDPLPRQVGARKFFSENFADLHAQVQKQRILESVGDVKLISSTRKI